MAFAEQMTDEGAEGRTVHHPRGHPHQSRFARQLPYPLCRCATSPLDKGSRPPGRGKPFCVGRDDPARPGPGACRGRGPGRLHLGQRAAALRRLASKRACGRSLGPSGQFTFSGATKEHEPVGRGLAPRRGRPKGAPTEIRTTVGRDHWARRGPPGRRALQMTRRLFVFAILSHGGGLPPPRADGDIGPYGARRGLLDAPLCRGARRAPRTGGRTCVSAPTRMACLPPEKSQKKTARGLTARTGHGKIKCFRVR